MQIYVFYFFVLQRTGSVKGEDIPYVLGLPIIGGGPFFPHNYTHGDVSITKNLIQYLSNFVKNGWVSLILLLQF